MPLFASVPKDLVWFSMNLRRLFLIDGHRGSALKKASKNARMYTHVGSARARLFITLRAVTARICAVQVVHAATSVGYAMIAATLIRCFLASKLGSSSMHAGLNSNGLVKPVCMPTKETFPIGQILESGNMNRGFRGATRLPCITITTGY